MSWCIICRSEFSGASRDEPATPCECGWRVTISDSSDARANDFERAYRIADAKTAWNGGPATWDAFLRRQEASK